MDALHLHETLSVTAVFPTAARNAVHGELAAAPMSFAGRPMVGFLDSDVPLLKKSDLCGIPGLRRGAAAGRRNYSGGKGATWMGREVVELLNVLRQWILLN